jgi:hypothetical protein
VTPPLTFMLALYREMPEHCAVQVWRKDTKKAYTYRAVEAAAEDVAKWTKTDVYVTAGMAPNLTSGRPTPTRLAAVNVMGIPGVWADIDVNGGPENKTGAAADVDAALELAHRLLEPTVLVNSGYGIQAWWLFDGVWAFGSPEEREQAGRLMQGFQAAIRAAAGFGLDSTHDLNRLMRIPGLFNHKGEDRGFDPAPTELLIDDGPRYDLAALTGVAREFYGQVAQATAQRAGANVNITISSEAMPSPTTMRKIELMRQSDSEFTAVWTKSARGKDAWSQSDWDLSMCSRLAQVVEDDQELANALVYYRMLHRPGDPKATRLDYVQRTVVKARSGSRREEDELEKQSEMADAVEQLSEIAAEGAPDKARTISLFNRICGGPEVVEFVQDSRDPETARYRLVLANGDEVPVGPVANLTDPGRFRNRFLTVTRHLIPRLKAKDWDRVVQALLISATVNEGKDDTRMARALAWAHDYTEHTMSTDRDAACQAKDPFEHDDRIHLHAGSMHHWLKRARQERIELADLRQYLVAAGFERKTINYQRDDKKTSTRSYYVIDRELLEGSTA